MYEPPYRKRWLDDSVITKQEKLEVDGYHLHSIRKAAADKLLSKGASSYINRIQTIAKANGIDYKGINKPEEFWDYLQTMSNHSITRIWYSGHASEDGLMLSLTHNGACQAAAFDKDMIKNSEISKRASLKAKFNSKSKAMSKFYGCYTDRFAKIWNTTFDVSSAGAKAKIDFGVTNRPSNIVNVMERIEKTPTSVGNPDWTVHK